MGSDFSTLDAELDALGTGEPFDLLELIDSELEGYQVEGSIALTDIDDALTQLSANLPAVDLEGYGADAPPRAIASARTPASEEIALPEPVLRDPRGAAADQSGELALIDENRSGSFALDDATIDPQPARASTREQLDDDLDELLVMTAEASPLGESSRATHGAPGTPREDGAPFATPFDAATRKSSMPAARFSRPPSPAEDDTDTFDSSVLTYAEAAPNVDGDDEDASDLFDVDELDSAEFEIVASSQDARPSDSSAAPPKSTPSSAPEKRPSFLGRLFGRKEE